MLEAFAKMISAIGFVFNINFTAKNIFSGDIIPLRLLY